MQLLNIAITSINIQLCTKCFCWELNSLQMHSDLHHLSSSLTKYFQVLEQKQSCEWVCLCLKQESAHSLPQHIPLIQHRNFIIFFVNWSDWKGTAQLMDRSVLTNQVAWAKHLYEFLKISSLNAFRVVFSLIYFFSRGWCMVGNVIYPPDTTFFGPLICKIVF